MPAIRLADIPNAGPQALGPSGNILAPQAAQLGSAATVSSRPLDTSARSMLTQSLELNAFSQEARAAGQFATAVGGLGDVAQKWGQKFADAKDAADTSKAEMVLQSAWEKQQNEQLGTPVDKWGELWARNQEEANRQLGEIGFSNNAAERINPYFEKWSALSTTKMNGMVRKQQINEQRSTMEANAYQKIASGDYEGAFAKMDESAGLGLHSAEEVTVWKSKLFDDQIRYARQQQKENLTMAITADPQGTMEKLDRAAKGEKTDLGDLKPTEVVYYKNLATRQERSNQVENWNTLIQKIQDGEITDKESLKKEAEGMKLDPFKIKRLEGAVSANIPFDQQAAVELKAKVANYDAFSDKDDSSYVSLASEIQNRLPKEHAHRLLTQLKSEWDAGFKGETKSPKRVWENKFVSDVWVMSKSGVLGDTGLDDKGDIKDQAAYNKHFAQVAAIQQGMEDWFNNPANKDKTPDDAVSYRDSLIKPMLQNGAKTNFQNHQTGWFSNFGSDYAKSISSGAMGIQQPTPTPTPPKPQDAKEKTKTVKAEGKVTSYNFPGDPYSDSNSRNGIGAWNNKLNENSLAISPDIERKFKDAGIGKGDPVELTLADGSTVIRNWDDRTSYKLRGRFDFHSPKAKQAKDGMAVVSWRKADSAS